MSSLIVVMLLRGRRYAKRQQKDVGDVDNYLYLATGPSSHPAPLPNTALGVCCRSPGGP